MDNLDFDQLLTIAASCEETIRRRLNDIARLEAKLKDTDSQVCTGQEYWRDKDKPTKTPKMCIIHSVNEPCPMHGEPKPGKRLHVYVGTKADKIIEAKAALERAEQHPRLEARIEAIRLGLHASEHHLRRFYASLGYDVGENGQLEPTEAVAW
ncbi:MAG: hypothetical protein GY832_04825 [Chloroflexi bacterium]|nr:hypothetical protein [Chloroflexota bacterium]